MSETESQTKAHYRSKLAHALDEAVSRLSELGVMELRRRMNTTSAIIRSVRSMFYGSLTIQGDLKKRQESWWPLGALVACLIVAATLHYLFRDASKTFDITFGAFFGAYGVLAYIAHSLDSYRMRREFMRHQTQINEMLYRWIANGGTESRFWTLRDQMDLDLGDIDMDSDSYGNWWYEMKADLVDSINGETPGTSMWRPTTW